MLKTIIVTTILVLGLTGCTAQDGQFGRSIPTISPLTYFGGGTQNVRLVSTNTKMLIGANSPTTGSYLETPSLSIVGLTNCDTIDTDANGVLSCGTDASGGGGGGSGSIGTSTDPTVGDLAYWDSVSTIGSVATGTLATDATGLEFDNSRFVVGGDATLSLSTGYELPTSTRLVQHDTAYSWGNHASAGYFPLSSWYATTTDGLAEGLNNLYFPGFTSLLADYSFTDNSSNWNTAFGWGNHGLVGYNPQSYASSTYVWASDWTTIDNYPAACSAGEFVRGIGDTLTCATDDTGTDSADDLSDDDLDALQNVAAMTEANGDILYYNTGAWQKLAKGSDGEVLKLASGLPSWGTDNSGSSVWTDNGDTLSPTNGEGFAVSATSTLDGQLVLTAQNGEDYGGWDSGEGLLSLTNTGNLGSAISVYDNSASTYTAPLIYVRVDNTANAGPVLYIQSDSTTSEGQVKISSPTPEIEMVESDCAGGKTNCDWEFRVQGDRWQVNSRNAADDSFEKLLGFKSTREGGTMQLVHPDAGEFHDFDFARFSIVGLNTATTTNYFGISSATDGDGTTGTPNGDIVVIDSSGNFGIATSTPAAKFSVIGNGYINGNLIVGTITSGVWNGTAIGSNYINLANDFDFTGSVTTTSFAIENSGDSSKFSQFSVASDGDLNITNSVTSNATTTMISGGFDFGNATNGMRIYPGSTTTIEFY